MPSFIKKNWLSLLTVALTAILLFAALTMKNGLGTLVNAVKHANLIWFFLGFVLIFMYWLLDAVALHMLTVVRKRDCSFIRTFVTAMLGLLYSAITPFATGGQPVQIYEMSKNGIKPGVAGAVIAVKSLVYQVAMLAYALSCAIFVWKLFDSQIPHFELYMIFGIVCNAIFITVILAVCLSKKITLRIAAAMIFLFSKLRLVKNYEKSLKKTYKQIKLFNASMATAMKSKRVSFLCLVVTIIQLTALFSVPYTIYRAFHFSEVTLFYIVSANAIISMITAFIPMPGGSGAAEGSFYLFFKIFFPASLLLPVVVIWRAVTYFSCIIFGCFVAMADSIVTPLLQKAKK